MQLKRGDLRPLQVHHDNMRMQRRWHSHLTYASCCRQGQKPVHHLLVTPQHTRLQQLNNQLCALLEVLLA